MPTNSDYKINNFSPDFRDALLLRNILADSVKDGGLSALLGVINKPAAVENIHGPHVQPSPDIETIAPDIRIDDWKHNKAVYISNDYRGANIPFITRDVPGIRERYGEYATLPINSPTTDGPLWRDSENTLLNLYSGGDQQYWGPLSKEDIKYDYANITLNTELSDNGIRNNPDNEDSKYRRELSITQNQYKSTSYEKISLFLQPFEINKTLATLNLDPNIYAPTLDTYTKTGVPIPNAPTGTVGDIRQFDTAKNMYLDVAKQTETIIETRPVAEQHTSYVDYNNNLNYGSAKSTQLIDVIGSVLGGNGVGFDPNSGSIAPDFDVRSSLAGRLLTAGGSSKDTKLGQISAQYLAVAIGNNIAFNLQEELPGSLLGGAGINLNPLSLAMGGSLIVPNNKITVRDGIGGGAVDILERMTGAKVPVSLLPASADIFTFGKKTNLSIGNIERANAFIANTGKGQVQALFGNINSNTNPNIIGKRKGYAPGFTDPEGNTVNKVEVYALAGKDGTNTIKDVLIDSPQNSPMSQSSYNLEGMVSNSGFDESLHDYVLHYNSDSFNKREGKFVWGDERWNKSSLHNGVGNSAVAFKQEKSLLYKTQQLFNNKGNNREQIYMKTLVSGKGVGATQDEISTTARGRNFMSKGSGVLKNGGYGIDTDTEPDELFVRAWSTTDSYNEYKDLQKHSALGDGGRDPEEGGDPGNIDASVLEDFGMVRIGPYDGSKIKKFMFSIENLAWDGETSSLPDCEVGGGDPLSGNKGRIMWFPPYDMVFNESTSANWDKTNFIGRGEPVYTYNNTERNGNLSWKIIIDHPNYLNFMKDRKWVDDDEMAAFFAGALDIPGIRNIVLSEDEKAAWAIANQLNLAKEEVDENTFNNNFNLYFKNDISDVPLNGERYENGLDFNAKKLDYELYPDGIRINEVEKISAPSIPPFTANTVTIVDEKIIYGEGSYGTALPFTKGNWPDTTNFGINGQNTKISLPGTDKENFQGWYDSDLASNLKTYLNKGGFCEYCKINITGYASPQGDSDLNKDLAENRSKKMKQWFIDNVFDSLPPGEVNKRFFLDSEAITNSGCKGEATTTPSLIPTFTPFPTRTNTTEVSSVDTKACKADRRVSVEFQYDPSLIPPPPPPPPVVNKGPQDKKGNFTIPVSRFYTECDYFKSVGAEGDTFVARDIKSKIKNFHAAFHSITPEGFNSRLTFLNQCTRQGPTKGSDNPENLAFGKPPVCILRIGDFYNTKIIIESLTIDYEPLVWDLNPEGVGVQPMIANINIGFAFIGGSSMKGPINRLQNAVSFNYFANTELYDPRADRIQLFDEPNGKGPTGKIVNSNDDINKKNSDLKAARDAANKAAEAEQEAIAEASYQAALAQDQAEEDAEKAAEANDGKILEAIKFGGYMVDTDLEEFLITLNIKDSDEIKGLGLTKEYRSQITVVDAGTNSTMHVGELVLKPKDDSSFTIETTPLVGGLINTVPIDLSGVGNGHYVLAFDYAGPINPATPEDLRDIIKYSNDFDELVKLLEPCVIEVLEPENTFGSEAAGIGGFGSSGVALDSVEPLEPNPIVKKRKPCPAGDNKIEMFWTTTKLDVPKQVNPYTKDQQKVLRAGNF